MTTTETKSFASPTASSFRRPAFTDAQMRMADWLNKAHVPFDIEKELPIAEKKTLRIDIAVPVINGTALAVEVMGDGSKSDDDLRDRLLREHGYVPLYFPNKMVELYPGYCVSRVKQAMALIKTI